MSTISVCFGLLLLTFTLGSNILPNLQYARTKQLIENWSHLHTHKPSTRPKVPSFLTALPQKLTAFDHEPKDIHDSSGYFFYYHHHRANEHGHIHFFKKCKESHHHLFAITFDQTRRPVEIFTTNLWVTEETRATKEQILQEIKQVHFNDENEKEMKEYLSYLTHLFMPQIVEVIEEKENYLEKASQKKSLESIGKDESIEILSQISIDIDTQNELLFN